MRDADYERVANTAQNLAPELLRYFQRRVHDPEEAVDLLGETLLVLTRRARAIPTADDQARMWCYGVARKVLLSYQRRGRRQVELADQLRGELRRTSHVAPENEQLHDALVQLDDLDREIIRLIHWDGFTQAYVAGHLNLPAGTVRSRYTRARRRLRAILDATAVEQH